MLTEEELIWSPVVANNRMNRLRGFVGVNSYEKDLKTNLVQTLLAHTDKKDVVHWLDVGCGVGKALIEAGEFWEAHYPDRHVQMTGIDLVDNFAPLPTCLQNVQFWAMPMHAWQPTQRYELITAVHSFHYFGDKLGILQKVLQALTPNGLFVGQVDLSSIWVGKESQEKSLATYLRRQGIKYNSRTKLLRCEGQKTLDLPYRFMCASDQAGANYTGQEAVRAFYEL